MKKIINISSLIGGLIACTTLQAAIISYGFGDGTSGTLAPTSNNTNIDTAANAADFGVGSGLLVGYSVDNGNAFGYVADPLNSATSLGGASSIFGHSSGTLANSITNNDYVSFTVSTTGVAFMNLTSLTFQYKANDTTRAADGLAVYSSINTDFSSLVSSTNIAATYGASVDTNANNAITEDAFHLITVDLSDSAYQNLDEITFRIYLFGKTSGSTSSSSSTIDDVTLNGLVVVPEPSSLALLLLASSSCLFMRSRKSSSKKAA